MASTYTKDDGEIVELTAELMKEHFPDLVEAGVTVEVLVARNEEDHAVKLRGWPCYATVRINNLKDRVAGLDDCRIVVDWNRWEELEEDKQRAIIHHELYHLVLRRKNMFVLKDDADRPMLKIKQHDWETGGFAAIAELYGESAPEYREYLAFKGDVGKGKKQKQSA